MASLDNMEARDKGPCLTWKPGTRDHASLSLKVQLVVVKIAFLQILLNLRYWDKYFRLRRAFYCLNYFTYFITI